MGTTAGDEVLEYDYPVAFGNAFSKTLATSKKAFRYLHLSGAVTERDQERALWFKGNMRKIKVLPSPVLFSSQLIISREQLKRRCSASPRQKAMKAFGRL